MKRKFNPTIFLVLSFFMMFSCDPIKRLRTNGKSQYDIYSDCGHLVINSNLVLSSFSVKFTPEFLSGNIEIEPSNLKYNFSPNYENQKTTISYFKVNEQVKGKFQISSKQFFIICFDIENNGLPEAIIIHPSDFLTCNGEPLIKDTIRIEL